MDKETIDKAIDIIHETTDLGKNVLEPASKNIGGALGTFTGFFENVVLYPLKCLNTRFEQKAIAFERKMQEKYNKIPEENRTDSPVNILGPTLEKLKYNIDEEYLQDLYANLLVSSMDKDTQKIVHPRYVNIISDMNEIDAKVFNYLYTNHKLENIRAGRVNIGIKNTNKVYTNATPEWLIEEDIEDYTIFDVSKSLIRLKNLGLIDLLYDRRAGESILESLYKKKEVVSVFNEIDLSCKEIEYRGVDCVIYINDDGRSFGEIVFGKMPIVYI